MKIATSQERLNDLFDRDIRNDSAIADELGISKQTVSAWRKGLRSPKKPMLIRLAEMYHVSIEWLMGFETEEGQSTESNEPVQPKTEEARILSRGIDKLSPEERAQALAVVRAMFAAHPEIFND